MPWTVTSEAPATAPEVGSEATPAPAAKAANELTEPVVPAVALPPISKVKLLAPLIVTTAPLLNVNCTASAANLVEETDKPFTNWILFAPLVSTIVIAALASIEFDNIYVSSPPRPLYVVPLAEGTMMSAPELWLIVAIYFLPKITTSRCIQKFR